MRLRGISALLSAAMICHRQGRHASTGKTLALIVAGYALAVGGGVAAVIVNELLMPADVAQTSGGMMAFGDMILFQLVTGFLGPRPLRRPGSCSGWPSRRCHALYWPASF